MKRRLRAPSPAFVISLIALFFVLGGSAFAASTALHTDKKADVKLIKKMAPSLSVKHAKSADSATHATSADSATNATNATTADNAPIVTDWVAYTPTLTNPPSQGATTTGAWRRVGDTMEIRIATTLSGSGDTTTHDGFFWSLPPSRSIDATKFPSSAGQRMAVGHGAIITNSTPGGEVASADVGAWDATTLFMQNGAGNWIYGNYQTYKGGDVFNFMARVPIVGWTYNK